VDSQGSVSSRRGEKGPFDEKNLESICWYVRSLQSDVVDWCRNAKPKGSVSSLNFDSPENLPLQDDTS
jgi:hypothetical protein